MDGCSLSGLTVLEGAQPRRRELRRESTLDEADVDVLAKTNQQRQISGESFTNGTLLAQLASEHCEAFRKLFRGKRDFVPAREITIGSACTGSSSEVAAAYYFEKAIKEVSDRGFRIKPLFSCDIREEKRKWIQGVHKAFASGSASGQGESSGPCVFIDIADLGSTMAPCATHGCKCQVPQCCIFVCCTSCKYFSRMSPPPQSSSGTGLVLLDPTSPGGSAQTFHGMLAYLSWARPAILIFENVEAINDVDATADVSNMDIILAELAARGYECQQMTGDASRYGAPQKRMRVYVIAVLAVANSQFDFLQRSIQDTFKTLRSLIKVCTRSPPCASEVIYSGSDSRVESWLQVRRQQQGNRKLNCYSMDKAITHAVLNGVSWSSIQPPERLKSSPWFHTLSAQQKQVAAYSLCTDTAPVLFRDISQSCGRVRCSMFGDARQHLSFTVTPAQVALVFKDNETPRLLLGEEAMLLQGFPIAAVSDLVKNTANHVIADLAGNMVAVPVLLVLLMAAVACVDWRDGDVDEEGQRLAESGDASEIDAAWFAFGLLVKAGHNKPDEGPARKRIKFC